jgi:hypothetical protein
MLRIGTTLAVLLVAVVTLAGLAARASAQDPDGAFSRLSPGQRKIARALFEAQPTTPGPNAPKPLTLDEIAAMKKPGGEGWGQVFKTMKSERLVTQKNLGEVVSSYERRHPETARVDLPRHEKAEKPDKMEKPERPAKPEKAERPERPERRR